MPGSESKGYPAFERSTSDFSNRVPLRAGERSLRI